MSFKCETSVRAIRSRLPCVAPPRRVPPHSPDSFVMADQCQGAQPPSLSAFRPPQREAGAARGRRSARSGNHRTRGPPPPRRGRGRLRQAGGGDGHTQLAKQDVRAPRAPSRPGNWVLNPRNPRPHPYRTGASRRLGSPPSPPGGGGVRARQPGAGGGRNGAGAASPAPPPSRYLGQKQGSGRSAAGT